MEMNIPQDPACRLPRPCMHARTRIYWISPNFHPYYTIYTIMCVASMSVGARASTGIALRRGIMAWLQISPLAAEFAGVSISIDGGVLESSWLVAAAFSGLDYKPGW
ncbi:hypothetical protein TWF696_009541 [Orbilia brochopaga]|uniref:Uncharacterized protein n=1 Tax=Orbilia brochopaga TaxID=3140254 RepID=A0AAV9UEF6_9PEZI